MKRNASAKKSLPEADFSKRQCLTSPQKGTVGHFDPRPAPPPSFEESRYLTMPVCVEDAEGLAELHVECWEHEGMEFDSKMTKKSVIEKVTARFGHILQYDREVRRHEIVIDKKTGEILGYVRWVLPTRGKRQWLTRQIPLVKDAYERREYREAYEKTKLPFSGRPELYKEGNNPEELGKSFESLKLSTARQKALQRSKKETKRPTGDNVMRAFEDKYIPKRSCEDYIKLDYFCILPTPLGPYSVVLKKMIRSCISEANQMQVPIYCSILLDFLDKQTCETFKIFHFGILGKKAIGSQKQAHAVCKMPRALNGQQEVTQGQQPHKP